MAEEAAVALIL